MNDEELARYSIIISAIYLRTKFFPGFLHPKTLGSTLSWLKVNVWQLDTAAEVMASKGHWLAASRLRIPGLISWAQRLVSDGTAITVMSPEYPQQLLRRLGDAAPPALWVQGELDAESWAKGMWASVGGSREAPTEKLRFARIAGEAVARQGHVLVTGGAVGCDASAELGALEAGGKVIRILPGGIHQHPTNGSLCQLSLYCPSEDFSAPNAMERNALIYNSCERSLVAHARFLEGGSWRGAKEALRRRCGHVFVPLHPPEQWSTALCNLGAISLLDPGQFPLVKTREPGHLALTG